jgi:hypothetical protein
MNRKNNEQHVLPVLADLIGRGDGTFILKPRLPDPDLETWITIGEAARILGDIDRRAIHLWLGEYLVFCRPLPRKPKVSLRSALRLKRATLDPDFWENEELQLQIKERVRIRMRELANSATFDTCKAAGPAPGFQPGQP